MPFLWRSRWRPLEILWAKGLVWRSFDGAFVMFEMLFLCAGFVAFCLFIVHERLSDRL